MGPKRPERHLTEHRREPQLELRRREPKPPVPELPEFGLPEFGLPEFGLPESRPFEPRPFEPRPFEPRVAEPRLAEFRLAESGPVERELVRLVRGLRAEQQEREQTLRPALQPTGPVVQRAAAAHRPEVGVAGGVVN